MPDVLTLPEDRRPVAELGVDERASFIGRTYSHLFGAVIGFVLVELVLFRFTNVPEAMIQFVAGSQWSWLLFLGGFMIVGYVASRTAHVSMSVGAQYAALFGYVVAEALIFVPLLYIANAYAPGAIQSAALITVTAFVGLTAVAFVTRKNFSFLRSFLMYAFVIAGVLILASVVFGLTLGVWFMIAMVAVAGAAILYTTSNVLHEYPSDRHVAAALELFASVALLFYYVLMLVISLQSD